MVFTTVFSPILLIIFVLVGYFIRVIKLQNIYQKVQQNEIDLLSTEDFFYKIFSPKRNFKPILYAQILFLICNVLFTAIIGIVHYNSTLENFTKFPSIYTNPSEMALESTEFYLAIPIMTTVVVISLLLLEYVLISIIHKKLHKCIHSLKERNLLEEARRDVLSDHLKTFKKDITNVDLALGRLFIFQGGPWFIIPYEDICSFDYEDVCLRGIKQYRLLIRGVERKEFVTFSKKENRDKAYQQLEMNMSEYQSKKH